MTNYIERTKKGKGFSYTLNGVKVDLATSERIQSLAIPPAWQEVRIATGPHAKVQATGYDAKERKQYIYRASYTEKQEAAKFDRIIEFATQLPKLRKQMKKDLKRWRFDKRKVIAAAVSLMDEGYFRVGNQAYARQNKSYGLTTLRSKHVHVKGSKIFFDFIGKSGQEQHKIVDDSTLAKIISTLDNQPGYEIFRYHDTHGDMHTLTSHDINEYIKDCIGEEFSAKDFRTWGGTMLAAVELAKQARPDTKTARQKSMAACIKRVADKLGNTPAVAKSSYIDPRIFHTYDRNDGINEVYKTVKNMKPRKYLTDDERWVLHLLTK